MQHILIKHYRMKDKINKMENNLNLPTLSEVG